MILDGKKLAETITKNIADEVSQIKEKITLALILVGKNPASQVYVHNKQKACAEVGINFEAYFLDENIPQKEVADIIEKCNANPDVHGILVQMPLPSHIDADAIINLIDPIKDVDGLTTINQGKLFTNQNPIVPATPKGVMTLLQRYFIDIAGKMRLWLGAVN